jgi:Uma2 family endonuclease
LESILLNETGFAILPCVLATSPEIRFTVDEYFRMSDAGVFGDRRVELIHGRILQMHAQGYPHLLAISKINRALVVRFPSSKYWLAVQGTVTLNQFNAPDPDFYVLAVPQGTPKEKLPMPFLVIEVAATSYRRDKGIKLRRYAEAGIVDYWVVNLKQHRIEVHRSPENPTGRNSDWRYASVVNFEAGESIKLARFPKIQFKVSELLP